MNSKLILEDKTEFIGKSFGYEGSVSGEVVFTTGMVGYPESITDPSYYGQILVFTYPLIGNYGVAQKSSWESGTIKATAIIVSSYIDTPSHFQSTQTLGAWLKSEKVSGLEIKDTRQLAKLLREKGTMLGKIVIGDKSTKLEDPNATNLVEQVATKTIREDGDGKKTIILIDCGAKDNTRRHLLARNVKVVTVPWNYDFIAAGVKCDGVVVSNGPGDPKTVIETIAIVKKILDKKIPTLGICLGNQILCLAAGGDTYKLKFGHRGQNQPCVMKGSQRCFLTTQNHGYAISRIPKGFDDWFVNANDNTNEGIIHKSLPFMSVQFHPEVNPGPMDTEWIFDEFLKKV
jgi:carbamoyl-phosphate synthase small subunit